VSGDGKYPPGSFNAHWFNLFNAVSFQIILGPPIILYAKSIGASSTVLGIIASFTPIMTVFQLPAARHLKTYGYRQFVLMGWSVRTIFIFSIAAVPLLFFLDNASKMAILLASLFVFNLLRGISSAAWLPWITALIPPERRGRFISLDQLFIYLGCLGALVVSALVMTGRVEPWEYSVVFLLSGIGATVSLYFIRLIPEVHAEESVRRSAVPVPWRTIIAYPPFLRLMIFNLMFMAVLGSLGIFSIEYLRDSEKFDTSTILYLSAASFVGAIVMLLLTGRRIDSTGSKPVLRFSLVLFAVVILGWFAFASHLIHASFVLVAALNFISGLAGANFNLANARLIMATMPEMGRNHFFALFTVITSLGLGAAPVIWGVSLDMIGTYEAVTGVFVWGRHSIYFMALFVLTIAAILYARTLHEDASLGTEESSLIYGRLRRLARHWHR